MIYGAIATCDCRDILTVGARRRQARQIGRVKVLVTYQHHITATLSNQSGLAQTSLEHVFGIAALLIIALLQPSVVLHIHST